MRNFTLRKYGALLLVLVVVMGILSGCSKKDTTAGKEEDTTKTSEYDNSYSANGEPSKKLQELRKSGVLKVGSSGDAPFAYIDQATGEFSGVDAEIIKEVAKRLGIAKTEMELIPFSELILNVNSGNIDLIADCMYIRADRAEKVYFGDIWYIQGGGLLVGENSGISAVTDFDPSSTVVGYTTGTVWQTIVDGWKDQGLIKESRATGDQSESIVALQNGKIDAFLTDSTVLENLFANSPDTVKGLKMAEKYQDDPSAIGRIAPAVSFDDIAFMKEVNNVVAELRDEGFIKQVFEDYKLDPSLHMITNDQRTHDINTRSE